MEHSDLIKKYIPQDDVYLFNTGSARKAWLLYGCHYLPEEETHMFVLWAPNARSVSLVGPRGYIRERLAAFAEAGVTTMLVHPLSGEDRETLGFVEELVALAH